MSISSLVKELQKVELKKARIESKKKLLEAELEYIEKCIVASETFDGNACDGPLPRLSPGSPSSPLDYLDSCIAVGKDFDDKCDDPLVGSSSGPPSASASDSSSSASFTFSTTSSSSASSYEDTSFTK
ncbi:hypothetical protein DXG01_017108, partial [Tephrocybe rancida]